MSLPDLVAIERATALVHRHMPPTPQYNWPLIDQALGAEVWVKHENHTPLGAFKVRGGISYFDALMKRDPACPGVIAATRGNHGQSIGFAARSHGLPATIVAPYGNSREKNDAMRALGVTLIEHGDDFQSSLDHARQMAAETGLHFVPSFDTDLLSGVASYSLELFRAVADIDTLYVPIGLGSGICGAIAVRDALGLSTEIVGVVADAAPAYAKSFDARAPMSAPVEDTIADGMACRTADPQAIDVILRGAARIVTVSEQDLRAAMRLMFSATHNVCEGAGAGALAALTREAARMQGRRVAVVLTGGNIDSTRFAEVLSSRD
jgi:threonine dehydratase